MWYRLVKINFNKKFWTTTITLEIALITVEYGIYCPGGSIDLHHRLDKK